MAGGFSVIALLPPICKRPTFASYFGILRFETIFSPASGEGPEMAFSPFSAGGMTVNGESAQVLCFTAVAENETAH